MSEDLYIFQATHKVCTDIMSHCQYMIQQRGAFPHRASVCVCVLNPDWERIWSYYVSDCST